MTEKSESCGYLCNIQMSQEPDLLSIHLPVSEINLVSLG